MAKKCKGKKQGGGKKALVLGGVAAALLVGCKTVPATDADGNVLPDEPPVTVPDPDAIGGTITAVSTLLPPPWNLIVAAVAGGGAAAGVNAYNQSKRRRREDEEWEVVDE
jgi:hypothetical protein